MKSEKRINSIEGRTTALALRKSFICIAYAILLVLNTDKTAAQVYTWMNGSSQLNQKGIYGNKGVTSASVCPGVRGHASSFKDLNGNFWIFGGFGLDKDSVYDDLSDLWKFNPVLNQWTWMHGDSVVNQPSVYGPLGVFSSTCHPGARSQATSWTDLQGNFWMFGGYYVDTLYNPFWYNDFWKFDVTLNQWAWMGGSQIADQNGFFGIKGSPFSMNVPSARYDAVSWTDNNGNLWMFGGLGFDATDTMPGYLNDLWCYNPNTNNWCWVSGTDQRDQNAYYGTMVVPALNTIPGGRVSGRGVVDGTGNLWLFGGFGLCDIGTNLGELADLWKYDLVQNEWTYMKGSPALNAIGAYGTKGLSAPLNRPGARQSHSMWNDPNGYIWMFGGFGNDDNNYLSEQMNDLWRYKYSTNEWTWIKGSSKQLGSAIFGQREIPALPNVPSARRGANAWVQGIDTLWMFGGIGNINNSFGVFNDMWKFNICVGGDLKITSSQSVLCAGVPATLTANGGVSYSWNTTQTTSTVAFFPTPPNANYFVNAVTKLGCITNTNFSMPVESAPQITLSASRNLICSGESVSLTAGGAASYSWHTASAPTASVLTIKPTVSATINVSGFSQGGCTSTAQINIAVSKCTGLEENTTEFFKIFPNPCHSLLQIECPECSATNPREIEIRDELGRVVQKVELDGGLSQITLDLKPGIYFCRISENEYSKTTKLIVQ